VRTPSRYIKDRGGIIVIRVFILVTLIVGVVLIVSCSSAPVQPTATIQPTTVPVQPTVTVQPTQTPVQPTATTQPTAAPVQPTATVQPTKASAQPTVSAQPTPQASPSGQQKLNIDDYLPKGAGRDLMLRDCTSCHSFVPIVTDQRPNERWSSLRKDHRDKAPGSSETDYNMIFAYLMENFNNTKPEPKFPAWFMAQQQGIGE
jgi:hypothetical protein